MTSVASPVYVSYIASEVIRPNLSPLDIKAGQISTEVIRHHIIPLEIKSSYLSVEVIRPISKVVILANRKFVFACM